MPGGPFYWFGGRVVQQWFGLDIRLRRDFLCVHWRRSMDEPTRLRIYRSPDATPPAATWYVTLRLPWARGHYFGGFPGEAGR